MNKLNLVLLLVFTLLASVLIADIRRERREELGRMFVETAKVRYL
jgi:hypothetical protein